MGKGCELPAALTCRCCGSLSIAGNISQSMEWSQDCRCTSSTDTLQSHPSWALAFSSNWFQSSSALGLSGHQTLQHCHGGVAGPCCHRSTSSTFCLPPCNSLGFCCKNQDGEEFLINSHFLQVVLMPFMAQEPLPVYF